MVGHCDTTEYDDAIVSEIVPNLYISGDKAQFDDFDVVLNVKRLIHEGNAPKIVLENLSDIILFYLQQDKKVLVHCWGGVDRSPLVVAWHLGTTLEIPIEEAYQIIRDKRPWINDRTEWIV